MSLRLSPPPLHPLFPSLSLLNPARLVRTESVPCDINNPLRKPPRYSDLHVSQTLPKTNKLNKVSCSTGPERLLCGQRGPVPWLRNTGGFCWFFTCGCCSCRPGGAKAGGIFKCHPSWVALSHPVRLGSPSGDAPGTRSSSFPRARPSGASIPFAGWQHSSESTFQKKGFKTKRGRTLTLCLGREGTRWVASRMGHLPAQGPSLADGSVGLWAHPP